MARQVRIEFAGAVYHVMAMGDRREAIVRDDGDRRAFMRTLGEMCARSGMLIHAYALLDNHYHLIVETPAGNLVEAMRWLQNAHTRRFNTCHGLWGHVFGGRYKAVLIGDDGEYFMRAVDYVHLNPVRARLVEPGFGLERYPWCSLADYCSGAGRRPAWLVTGRVFAACGTADTPGGRRGFVERLERRVMEQGADKAAGVDAGPGVTLSLQATLRRGWCFGSDTFKERMIGLLARSVGGEGRRARHDGYHGSQANDHGEACARAIIAAGCQAWGLRPEALKRLKGNDPRKVFIAELIWSETTVRLDWVRAELGMGSRSNCSHLIGRYRAKLPADAELHRKRQKVLADVNSQ